MDGESELKRTQIPAESWLRPHTADRTLPSALAGSRSKGDLSSDSGQPLPSTVSVRTSCQTIFFSSLASSWPKESAVAASEAARATAAIIAAIQRDDAAGSDTGMERFLS